LELIFTTRPDSEAIFIHEILDHLHQCTTAPKFPLAIEVKMEGKNQYTFHDFGHQINKVYSSPYPAISLSVRLIVIYMFLYVFLDMFFLDSFSDPRR